MYKYCTILLLVEYCNLCVVGATMLHTHSVVCFLAWFWRGCACFLIHVAAVQPEHAQHSNYAALCFTTWKHWEQTKPEYYSSSGSFAMPMLHTHCQFASQGSRTIMLLLRGSAHRLMLCKHVFVWVYFNHALPVRQALLSCIDIYPAQYIVSLHVSE